MGCLIVMCSYKEELYAFTKQACSLMCIILVHVLIHWSRALHDVSCDWVCPILCYTIFSCTIPVLILLSQVNYHLSVLQVWQILSSYQFYKGMHEYIVFVMETNNIYFCYIVESNYLDTYHSCGIKIITLFM